ncbi:MAG: hypothetical protein B7Y31_13105, partial [Novosphingobium sp. 16-62-11]
DIGSLLADTIIGMRTVNALGAEDHEAERFGKANGGFVATMLKMQTVSFLTGALPGTIVTASSAAVILYGGKQIIDGTMTIGALVAFITYHGRLLAPVQALMGLTASLAMARVALARIFELFDTAPEVVEAPSPWPLPGVTREIRLEGVTMHHGREPVLQGASLAIPAGSLTAIIGPSGAGKSTMADLLVRFLDPVEGRVTIDGADVRELSLSDLRTRVLLVDQAPFLFNASIAQNIAFARGEASDADIASAASAAGLDALITRLPEGLALAHIGQRLLERGLRPAQRAGGDVEAPAIEPRHGELEAVAFRAEAVFHRHAAILEDDGAGGLNLPAHLLLVGAEGQAGRPRFHENGGHTGGAGTAGAHHHHIEIRRAGAGNELLLPVQHIMVAIAHRTGLERGRI